MNCLEIQEIELGELHAGTQRYLLGARNSIKQEQAPCSLCKHPSSFGYCCQPLPSLVTGGWLLGFKKLLTFMGARLPQEHFEF